VPRILVVDDEPLISMMVEDWLIELGCEVVGPAGSVEDGLTFADIQGLDGAILDLKLGDQDCYPLANVLRARGIPFAFATGAGDVGVASGFDNPLVLAKPFDFEGVKAVLSKMLEQRASAGDVQPPG
jgi:DNA-binding response OmpR family regulator